MTALVIIFCLIELCLGVISVISDGDAPSIEWCDDELDLKKHIKW